MNVTLVHTAAGVSFADLQVRVMLDFMYRSNGFPTGISDAYYCAECTRLEKDRDGCPKIVNLGASRTDLFYERRRLGMCERYFCPQILALTIMPGFKKG